MTELWSFLLIEDDEVDAEAFRRAVLKRKLGADLDLARDGAEGLRILRRRHHDRGAPFIVFLDLNMTGMNGHEFLRELRADPEIAGTTVFVLTSSHHDRDIRMAYEQNVAGYYLKSEIDSLLETIACFAELVTRGPVEASPVAQTDRTLGSSDR